MDKDWEKITPDEVLQYKDPCRGYICPLSANIYNITFRSFRISDYDSKKVVYEVSRGGDAEPILHDLDPDLENMVRSVQYTFPKEFLGYKTIRTMLEFSVGSLPANNFRMIERHYFKGKLIRSYDFTFGFCIPGSVNSWEAIYDVPETSKDLLEDMVSCPFEHKSDSFYFVDNKLIMHNKAEYEYVDDSS